MSHFTVLVAAHDEDDLEAKLLPYHEYECTGIVAYTEFVPHDPEEMAQEYERHKDDREKDGSLLYADFDDFVEVWFGGRKQNGVWGRITNPNAKWDWWVVGGRWSGLLRLKPGATGRNGEGGAFSEPNSDPQYADVAEIGDIDWQWMRDDRAQKARDLWQQYQPIVPLRNAWWEMHKLMVAAWEIRKEKGEEDVEAVDAHEAAKEAAEPARKALNKAEHEHGIFLMDAERVEDLCSLDEEAYVAKHGSLDALTHAFVNLEGEWHEDSEMGWWGITHDIKEGYRERYWAFLEALLPDQLVYVVDCHI